MWDVLNLVIKFLNMDSLPEEEFWNSLTFHNKCNLQFVSNVKKWKLVSGVLGFCFPSQILKMQAFDKGTELASTYQYNLHSNKQFVSNVKSVRNSRLFLSIFCDEGLLLVSYYSMDKKFHHILCIHRNYCIVFDLLRIYLLYLVAWEPYIYDRFLCKSI